MHKHPPFLAVTVKGHLDQQWANLHSTQPKLPVDMPPTPDSTPMPVTPTSYDTDKADFNLTPDEPLAVSTNYVFASFQPITRQVFTNQTGCFPTISMSGHKDILIMYCYDSNYIHAEPMRSHTGAEIVAAYQHIHKLLTEHGLKPQLQKLDNEASEALQQFMTAEDIDYQLAPPHIHQCNAAECAIRMFRNHFIASLCSSDKDFPLRLWDKLLPQAIITLNLLHGSQINLHLSAWAQVHGNMFDHNCTPLVPPGTHVLVHEKPSV